MSDHINLNQPSEQIILDLLNHDNNRNLTLEEVEIKDAEAAPVTWPRNTKAIAEAIPGSGYSNSIAIYYNRLDLGVYFSNTNPVVVADDIDTTTAALPFINQTYNLQLTEDDIQYELVSGYTHVFKAAPGSLVWIGQVEMEFVPEADGDIDIIADMPTVTFAAFTAPTYDTNIGYDLTTKEQDGFEYS